MGVRAFACTQDQAEYPTVDAAGWRPAVRGSKSRMGFEVSESPHLAAASIMPTSPTGMHGLQWHMPGDMVIKL